MMTDVLRELTARRAADAAGREKEIPFAAVMRRVEAAAPPRPFRRAFPRGGTNVIAELKKASPSEGLIRSDFRPAPLAAELEGAGAAALSVLCEPHRFLGGEAYLREARAAVGLPILYKDFVTTRYQVAEARAAGADAVLLIVAALEADALAGLVSFAGSIGLSTLVETHGADEIAKAVDAGAEVVGVNCRDLRDFSTDVSLLERLVGTIPAACTRIAESGMRDAASIAAARRAGADGFLVGTALMRSPSPGLKLRELVSSDLERTSRT